MRLGDRFERWGHLYAAFDPDEENDAPARSLHQILTEAANGEDNRTSPDARPPRALSEPQGE
jgi:hypothetical protein